MPGVTIEKRCPSRTRSSWFASGSTPSVARRCCAHNRSTRPVAFDDRRALQRDRSRLERRLARQAVAQRQARLGREQPPGDAHTPAGDRLRAGWLEIGHGIAVDIDRHERQHWLSELREHVGVGRSLEIEVGAAGPLRHGAQPCVIGSRIAAQHEHGVDRAVGGAAAHRREAIREQQRVGGVAGEAHRGKVRRTVTRLLAQVGEERLGFAVGDREAARRVRDVAKDHGLDLDAAEPRQMRGNDAEIALAIGVGAAEARIPDDADAPRRRRRRQALGGRRREVVDDEERLAGVGGLDARLLARHVGKGDPQIVAGLHIAPRRFGNVAILPTREGEIGESRTHGRRALTAHDLDLQRELVERHREAQRQLVDRVATAAGGGQTRSVRYSSAMVRRPRAGMGKTRVRKLLPRTHSTRPGSTPRRTSVSKAMRASCASTTTPSVMRPLTSSANPETRAPSGSGNTSSPSRTRPRSLRNTSVARVRAPVR